jgi:hypothetical protein
MIRHGYVPTAPLFPTTPVPGGAAFTGVIGTTKTTAESLRLLGYRAVLARTGANGGGLVNRCWTTPAGYAALLLLKDTALFVGVSIPELARRVKKRPDLLKQWDSARRLGADDDSLLAIVEPLRRRG